MAGKLIFALVALTYFDFIPTALTQTDAPRVPPPSCMQQFLTNAGLSPTAEINLWQADLDETNIPKTNPYLLAYVFSRGVTSSSAVASARSLQDCISGVGTIPSRCSLNVPCRNGGVCVRGDSRGSYKCQCKNPFVGASCEETTSVHSLDACCKKNQEILTAVLAQVRANAQSLASNAVQIASIKKILKYDTAIIPNITGICPPDQTILGSGLYRIHLPNVQAFTAYCDMETDGGGYLVFQRREDGSVDFYRDYAEYVKGFGDQRREHWLGLELLHRLTSSLQYELRVDLADWSGQTAYAKYSTFSIANASDGYRLTVGGYSGTAGDSMYAQGGSKFSTRDLDQDLSSSHCATLYRGAWWYGNCHSSNLNSVYERATVTTYANTVVWYEWKGHKYSLKSTEMKIRLLPQ